MKNVHAVVARSTFVSKEHLTFGPVLEVEMSKKCTPLWREAHFQVKMYKTQGVRTTFWRSDAEKKCTPLWREARFQVKMYRSTPGSDHFWKLSCRKSGRRCGAKHISKTKTHQVRTTFWCWDVEKVRAVVARSTFPSQNAQKHTSFGPLFDVEMSKKCTWLWREAHFQVKMYKTPHVRITFWCWDVEKCTPLWREARFQVKSVNYCGFCAFFWRSDVGKVDTD